MEKQNKFKIIIASYNNEDWVEYNLASIINQTYDNYEVIYVDDNSTDNTVSRVEKIIENRSKFTLIKNDTNLGGTYNHLRFFEGLTDDEIILFLDGDDWLFDDDVLMNLNSFYNNGDYWMTYGKLYAYDGNAATEGCPQNTPYSDFRHDNKLYRRDAWRASHLRSFKGFLLKAVDKRDMISLIDNKLYHHAGDLALAFPCLEMCPKEKIGVVGFPTYVYNATPKAQVRTRDREHVDNSKYEHEIRNRKQYKEGLSGEKLPQVNVIGYFQETNYIPKTFSFVYGLEHGEFDLTMITDADLLPYLKGVKKFPNGKIVADLHETPIYSSVQQEVYRLVKDQHAKFDLILTHNTELLQLPNAKLRFCMFSCLNKNIHTRDWPLLADDSLYNIYPKSKLLSCISSNKSFLEGHRKRLDFIDHALSSEYKEHIDMFGMGFRNILGKIEGLRDYRFSIAIENTYADNECTEKIGDCFLTGTIPIYYGCPNIGNYFDSDGIFTFNSKVELDDIIKKIIINGNEIYQSKLESIQTNFKLAQKYVLNSDSMYNQYFKELINDKT